MDRTPPIAVRRVLRQEMGFGCPVPGCGNPYLEWHHFDPPWREREHHDPGGMIALCAQHHRQADGGAFTSDQLRELKQSGKRRHSEARGRFNWMRNSLLAIVGGSFYYETLTIFKTGETPRIWLRRDEEGYLLLNVSMPTTSQEPRLILEDNFWLLRGTPTDFECPPSGRLIHAKYDNGDEIRIEFFEVLGAAALKSRYSTATPESWPLTFPITAVEVQAQIGGTPYGFGSSWTKLPGLQLRGVFGAHSDCAICLT